MPPPDDVSPLGLRPGPRRGAEGFFGVVQDTTGHWRMQGPEGAPLFVCGVHGVSAPGSPEDRGFPPDPAACLRRWGFNAVGVGGLEPVGREDGLPYVATADFIRVGRQMVAPGLRLPDVFDPDWAQRAAERALVIAATLGEDRALIGWVTDGDLDWGLEQPAGRPSLLQLCLSLEPGFPAYHAAWEFVLALHRNRLDELGEAWELPLANREVIREMTRREQALVSRGYQRDEARWAREFARRYFTATAAALRAADPVHLLLGCRFRRPVGAAVLAECAYPAVDVALPHWQELPAAGARPGHPVLAGDVDWTTGDFLRPPPPDRPGRLTTVERMLQRGRLSLGRLARHPAVVGYFWGRWQDEPGEQPPFARGLVHVDGGEAREHTELLAAFNVRQRAAG